MADKVNLYTAGLLASHIDVNGQGDKFLSNNGEYKTADIEIDKIEWQDTNYIDTVNFSPMYKLSEAFKVTSNDYWAYDNYCGSSAELYGEQILLLNFGANAYFDNNNYVDNPLTGKGYLKYMNTKEVIPCNVGGFYKLEITYRISTPTEGGFKFCLSLGSNIFGESRNYFYSGADASVWRTENIIIPIEKEQTNKQFTVFIRGYCSNNKHQVDNMEINIKNMSLYYGEYGDKVSLSEIIKIDKGSSTFLAGDGVYREPPTNVYTLPTATKDKLGGIKIGKGLKIDENSFVSSSNYVVETVEEMNNLTNIEDGDICIVTKGEVRRLINIGDNLKGKTIYFKSTDSEICNDFSILEAINLDDSSSKFQILHRTNFWKYTWQILLEEGNNDSQIIEDNNSTLLIDSYTVQGNYQVTSLVDTDDFYLNMYVKEEKQITYRYKDGKWINIEIEQSEINGNIKKGENEIIVYKANRKNNTSHIVDDTNHTITVSLNSYDSPIILKAYKDSNGYTQLYTIIFTEDVVKNISPTYQFQCYYVDDSSASGVFISEINNEYNYLELPIKEGDKNISNLKINISSLSKGLYLTLSSYYSEKGYRNISCEEYFSIPKGIKRLNISAIYSSNHYGKLNINYNENTEFRVSGNYSQDYKNIIVSYGNSNSRMIFKDNNSSINSLKWDSYLQRSYLSILYICDNTEEFSAELKARLNSIGCNKYKNTNNIKSYLLISYNGHTFEYINDTDNISENLSFIIDEDSQNIMLISANNETDLTDIYTKDEIQDNTLNKFKAINEKVLVGTGFSLGLKDGDNLISYNYGTSGAPTLKLGVNAYISSYMSNMDIVAPTQLMLKTGNLNLKTKLLSLQGSYGSFSVDVSDNKGNNKLYASIPAEFTDIVKAPRLNIYSGNNTVLEGALWNSTYNVNEAIKDGLHLSHENGKYLALAYKNASTGIYNSYMILDVEGVLRNDRDGDDWGPVRFEQNVFFRHGLKIGGGEDIVLAGKGVNTRLTALENATNQGTGKLWMGKLNPTITDILTEDGQQFVQVDHLTGTNGYLKAVNGVLNFKAPYSGTYAFRGRVNFAGTTSNGKLIINIGSGYLIKETNINTDGGDTRLLYINITLTQGQVLAISLDSSSTISVSNVFFEIERYV